MTDFGDVELPGLGGDEGDVDGAVGVVQCFKESS